MPEPLWLILLVNLVILTAAFVQSAIGFGQALIAMPLLALLVGIQTATPLVAMAGFTASLFILLRQPTQINLGEAWRLILASALGVPIGVYLLTRLPEWIVVLALGILLILFALYNLAQLRLPTLHATSTAYGFGLVSGMLGGAYNTSGPPLVIYGMLRRWAPEQFPATLQSVFLTNGVLVLLVHHRSGLWTPQVLALYLAVIPFIPLATLLGRHLNQSLPRERFAQAIYILLILLGGMLLWDGLTKLVAIW